jgi:membrane protein DedA with SNARE-associated domain
MPNATEPWPDDRSRRARRWRLPFTYASWLIVLIALSVFPLLFFDGDFTRLAHRAINEDTPRLAVAAVAIALLIVDLFLVIPSGLIIALMGGFCGAVFAVGVGSIGLTLCCALGYGIGRSVGSDLAGDREEQRRFSKTIILVHKHGPLMLAVCRPIPVLGELSVIAAGALGLPVITVLVTTLLANIGIACVYALIGAGAREGASGLATTVLAALALPAASYGLMRIGEAAADFLGTDPAKTEAQAKPVAPRTVPDEGAHTRCRAPTGSDGFPVPQCPDRRRRRSGRRSERSPAGAQ